VIAGCLRSARLRGVCAREATHEQRPGRTRVFQRARCRQASRRIRAAQAGHRAGLIDAGNFTAYPDALRFVIPVKDAGLLVADARSSKNATSFLRKIRLDTFAKVHEIAAPTMQPGMTLLDYFDADVSGRDFAHGKPDQIFLTSVHELGVEPPEAIVTEDAAAAAPVRNQISVVVPAKVN
jgi:beta-phosphoglucomutase-like phosphatase (HAD superfamily)